MVQAARLVPGALIAGSLGAQCFTSLPPGWLICSFGLASLILLIRRKIPLLALAALACCLCLMAFHLRLEDRLDAGMAGQLLTVEGLVSGLPNQYEDYVRFRFEPDASARVRGLPSALLVYAYQDWPEISAGQRWRLEIKLKPPWGRVNFLGEDRERWLFSQGIGGVATARSGSLLPEGEKRRISADGLRGVIRATISSLVGDERRKAIIQALATADRSRLGNADWSLLEATGTSHLLAISGLHIGLAAMGGYWLTRLLLWFLPASRLGALGFYAMITGGMLFAVAYAALAGFGVPTLRAVLMLSLVAVATALPRKIHPLRAWSIALALMLLLNPFAALGAGSWFSFLAVAALLCLFYPRTGRLSWWKTLLLAQAGVLLVLSPLGATWFNSVTPAAFPANLVAIPLVSFLVVPFVLSGIALLAFSETLAGMSWSIAGQFIAVLLGYLELINGLLGPATAIRPPGVVQVVLALLGGFLMLLPRGVNVRLSGLFLLVPLFLPASERSHSSAIEAQVLDVGQGTAVLLRSGNHVLLYDSGPGDGGDYDLVKSVIAPAIARLGPGGPELVVISHGDLDHAGGLQALLQRYPDAEYHANLQNPQQRTGACRTGAGWQWEGLSGEVLHPSPGLPYLGNDSSCVISIRHKQQALLLLAGDISKAVESRLVEAGLSSHRVLLVPHHGSKTSSSRGFIDQVNPELAIATAGLGNRFGFPRDEIRQRYVARGVNFWSTAECGAIRLLFHADGTVEAASARRRNNRIWRWPAAANCP
jgi:competence protein ComEC